jgi:hypothetical protein
MRTSVRRVPASIAGLMALAAIVPDVRWCEAAWADIPVECLLASETQVACAAEADFPARCSSSIAIPDCSTESSCEIDPPCADDGDGRAWCPSAALGQEGLPGHAPEIPSVDAPASDLPETQRIAISAPRAAPDVTGIPPPITQCPLARPPVRAPPRV